MKSNINNTILELIERCLKLECYNDLSWLTKLKEFKTLTISLPRIQGNTKLAFDICKKYKKLKPIYICCNGQNAINASRIIDKNTKIATHNNLDKLKGIYSELIIIDNSSILTEKQNNNIYNFMFGNANNIKLIIKVG